MIEAVFAVVGLIVTLQGAILAYVISIERRLTRLETTIAEWREQRRGRPPGDTQGPQLQAR